MTWPKVNLGDTTYVLKYPHDIKVKEPIVLPDNLTIQLPPSWPKLSNGHYVPLIWETEVLEFGVGCVISLYPQTGVPSKAPAGSDGFHGILGMHGGNGGDGVAGTDGMTGVDLNLSVKTWLPKGSLWICLDGMQGGDGGEGGEGGKGGDSVCTDGFLGRKDGGDGGNGGRGGIGGRGGDVARLIFEIRGTSPMKPPPVPGCDDGYSPSNPPSESDDGKIYIYGRPGRGGRGGSGGSGGIGGNGQDCLIGPFNYIKLRPGQPGKPGQDSSSPGLSRCFDAPSGSCRTSYVNIHPPESESK